jgi:hypothetical protein
VNTYKIKYLLRPLLACIIVWGFVSVPQALADDFSPDSSTSLTDTNLQSFSSNDENTPQEIKAPPEAPKVDLQLYQANVPVTDSSDAERYKAFSASLKKILIKLSLNPKVDELPTVKSALTEKNAENFVEQFSYGHAPLFQLNVHFNSDEINALLTKAKQPVLNQRRPSAVIWLIIHQVDGSDHIIGGALSEETLGADWVKSIHESADAIGFPILFPFGDLDDLSALPSKDLGKITPEKLREASERYGTENILVIKMVAKQAKTCSSQWSLLSEEDHSFDWQESAATCQVALQEGIIKTLRNLLLPTKEKEPKHSVTPPPEPIHIIHLSVIHIQSAENYQQVLDTLQNQPGVTDVEIEKVTPTQVSYTLKVKGNLTDITQALSNYSTLQLLQKNEQTNTVEYTFMGNPSTNVWEEQ